MQVAAHWWDSDQIEAVADREEAASWLTRARLRDHDLGGHPGRTLCGGLPLGQEPEGAKRSRNSV
jgi:hypothetical protein